MFRYFFLLFSISVLALPVTQAAGLSKSETRFVYVDANGKVQSTEVVSRFTGKLRNPLPHLDPKLARAATIAEERAHAHSRSRCWRYVKEALLAAGAVDSYPKTALARQAGDELVHRYGFKRLPVSDPYLAPIGSVLVYGSGRAAGHVEIRTGPRVRERLPGSNTFAPSIDWRLRQDVVIVATASVSRILRTGAGR